jgi:lipoyl(octanoyl) transferase
MTEDAIDAAVPRLVVRGHVPYEAAVDEMKVFTAARGPGTADEIWLVEHAPVYTQGLAGKAEHLLAPGEIPVVQTNRGGQVTYHGPGQVVAYPLVDLRRLGIYVKEYVYRLEDAILRTLEDFGVTGHRVAGAPGIYVRLDDPFGHSALAGPRPPDDPFRGLGKIAALGVKVSNHCTYHGVALNVAMDLRPFDLINPCGYAGLKTVDLATLGIATDWAQVARCWAASAGAVQSLTRPREFHFLAPCDCECSLLSRRRRAAALLHVHRTNSSVAATTPYDASAKQKGPGQDVAHPDQGRSGGSAEEARVDPRPRRSPTTRFYEIKQILREHKLHTVCEEAPAQHRRVLSARAPRRS